MKNKTDITCILDKSGSMSPLRDDTIGSFNTFLEEQKVIPGEAVLTIVMFNGSSNITHNTIPLADAVPLDTSTYSPSGGTALLDTLGITIYSTGQRLAALPESERPDKVVFFIITDGEENASRSYLGDEGREKIKQMITHQQEVYNWTFIFAAANQDAFAVGQTYGFTSKDTSNYVPSTEGTKALWSSNSGVLRSIRIGDRK